jgi:hypothetical protein
VPQATSSPRCQLSTFDSHLSAPYSHLPPTTRHLPPTTHHLSPMSTATPICISPQDTLPYPMKSTHEPPTRVIVTNTAKRSSTRRPRRRSRKASHPRTLTVNVASPEGLAASDLKGLSVTNSTRSPAKTRHKSNGTARTQKKLAQQIIFAHQLITAARRRRRNLVKQLKRNGFASLIASLEIEVPESHLAENAALKNSYSQIKRGLRFHAPA